MIEQPFKTKPFKHQLDCLERSKDRRHFAIFGEMGTGKSKMLIDTIVHLYLHQEIDKALIIAPKGVYRNWDDVEIPAHMPDQISRRVACWAAELRKKDRERLEALDAKTDDLKILLVNVEALSTEKGPRLLRWFMKHGRTLLAVDESTTIKNHAATRTKSLITLGMMAKYRRIMSGEPAANSPLNLYSQFRFLDRELLGFSSFFAFRSRYAHMEDSIGTGGRVIKVVKGYRNVEELQSRISPHSFIVKKEDCLDLPPKVFVTRDVHMGKFQAAAYEEMRANAYFEIGKLERPIDEPVDAQLAFEQLIGAAVSEGPKAEAVSANIVLTQLLRLHQIACGFMVTETGQELDFDEKNDRIEQTLQVIEEAGSKVIVWATYRRSIMALVEAVSERFGPGAVVSYFGDTSRDDRARAVREFQDPDSPVRVFVGNQQTAGYGITLTQAGVVIYYANSYDNEHRGQSEDRAHRIGQTKSVTYVDLVARGTVDEKIIKALKAKERLSDALTASNWRNVL